MDFTGRYPIPASPEIVWEALNNPETLRACIPGCERLERVGPERYEATAVVKIGPVKATFKANITQSELDPPWRCVLKGEGQGGAAGFTRGEAEVTLAPDGDATTLSYTAKATIGGKLAQIGQRLIDGAAKQVADEFFGRFAARVAAAAGTAAPEPDVAAVSTAAPPPPQAPVLREGLAPEIWVVGLIAIIIILLAIFGVLL
jgi:carbon monoxide dehydrogenase subunit G